MRKNRVGPLRELYKTLRRKVMNAGLKCTVKNFRKLKNWERGIFQSLFSILCNFDTTLETTRPIYFLK